MAALWCCWAMLTLGELWLIGQVRRGWMLPRMERGVQHPRPWWYSLALRVAPGRCREIPEATDVHGVSIVLRQVAIIKRYVYLQQFAGSEHPDWAHSHQWSWTIAIGLWGGYIETRPAGIARARRAPYLYAMDASVIHQVSNPSAGHTSIFIGLWRDDALKTYFHLPSVWASQEPWEDHVQVQVARI